MKITSDKPGVVSPAVPSSGTLKKGAIGVTGAALLAVASIAPLTTFASNLSLSLVLGVGPATVLLIALAAVIFVFFAAGWVALGRHVLDSGAYPAYVAHGLGRTTGSAIGVIATSGYNFAVVAMIGLAGYFLNNAIAPTGLELPWWLYSLVVLIGVGVLGYLGIDVGSKFTAVICGLQFVLLGAFVIAALVNNPTSFPLEDLSPSALEGGAVGLTLVFVVLSLVGFESTATFSEEVRDPERTVPRAVYLALFLVSAVFLIGTWAVVAASDGDPAAVAAGDPGSLIPVLAGNYFGGWATIALNWVIAISIIGAAIAFHNLSTRYLFSSARAGIFPAALARTHPRRQTPHVAVVVQIGLTALFLVPFVIAGASPILVLFPALAGYNALAITIQMISASLSVVVGSVRGRVTGSVYATRIAPVLAMLGLLTLLVLIVRHYSAVTDSDLVWVNYMPLLLIVLAGYGAFRQRHINQKGIEVG